jgi:YVTN family beta-propeller protein
VLRITTAVLLLIMVLLLLPILALYYYLTYTDNNAVIAQENSPISNNFTNNNNSISNIDSNRSDGIINASSSFSSSSESNSGIDVHTFPVGIAVNPNTKKVYVANEYSNTVSVIDTETDKVQATIHVGSFPYGIDTNPLNNRVYVTNRGSNTVSVIDGSIDTKLLDLPVGKSPVGIAVNPSTNLIYVTNFEDGTLSVIDDITNEVIDTISVGKTPYGIAVNPLSNKIYVADIITDTVSVIDGKTNKVTAKISVGKKPTDLAIDIAKGNPRLYVTNYDSDSVSVIDTLTNNVIDNITSVGDSPVGIAINPISSNLYVSNIASNTVSVIDTKALNIDDINNNNNKTKTKTDTTLLPTTAIKKNKNIILKEIRVNPTLKESYSGEDSLVNLPSNVSFPLIASHITINPYENRAYITNTGSNTISIINGDSNEVAVRLTFNVNPPHTGEIRCNGEKNISGNSTSYNKGQILQCTAIPERGYAFASWSDLANDLNSNPLTLEISRFGTLTANFKSAITPEVYIFAIGGIVGATSVFVGWYYKYGQRRYINRYLTRIQSTYDTLHEEDKQQCILELQRIRTELIYLFKKGSLSDSHYNILDKKASDYIEIVRNEEEEEEEKQT